MKTENRPRLHRSTHRLGRDTACQIVCRWGSSTPPDTGSLLRYSCFPVYSSSPSYTICRKAAQSGLDRFPQDTWRAQQRPLGSLNRQGKSWRGGPRWCCWPGSSSPLDTHPTERTSRWRHSTCIPKMTVIIFKTILMRNEEGNQPTLRVTDSHSRHAGYACRSAWGLVGRIVGPQRTCDGRWRASRTVVPRGARTHLVGDGSLWGRETRPRRAVVPRLALGPHCGHPVVEAVGTSVAAGAVREELQTHRRSIRARGA
jgi:hypothetical protein